MASRPETMDLSLTFGEELETIAARHGIDRVYLPVWEGLACVGLWVEPDDELRRRVNGSSESSLTIPTSRAQRRPILPLRGQWIECPHDGTRWETSKNARCPACGRQSSKVPTEHAFEAIAFAARWERADRGACGACESRIRCREWCRMRAHCYCCESSARARLVPDRGARGIIACFTCAPPTPAELMPDKVRAVGPEVEVAIRSLVAGWSLAHRLVRRTADEALANGSPRDGSKVVGKDAPGVHRCYDCGKAPPDGESPTWVEARGTWWCGHCQR